MNRGSEKEMLIKIEEWRNEQDRNDFAGGKSPLIQQPPQAVFVLCIRYLIVLTYISRIIL